MRKHPLIPDKIMMEKLIAALVCLAGVVGVCYGMIKPNNVVFVLGLILVIIGYLIIRRKLKSQVPSRHSRE